MIGIILDSFMAQLANYLSSIMNPFIQNLTNLQIKSGDFFSAEVPKMWSVCPCPLGNLHSPLSAWFFHKIPAAGLRLSSELTADTSFCLSLHEIPVEISCERLASSAPFWHSLSSSAALHWRHWSQQSSIDVTQFYLRHAFLMTRTYVITSSTRWRRWCRMYVAASRTVLQMKNPFHQA